ncbi:MAG: hypothetical protein KGH61_03570 [Candidatus Micrarchaeota archaeon]|nr:hypothetical protein [Candidatus Micrarchaeota archaeon]MDE1848002.1 hypothetical protein [Candidatus Micrarchaeota archaeon]MDE1864706.1 hypothetical protein [Candidatus Micrarchaeota archaeon]
MVILNATENKPVMLKESQRQGKNYSSLENFSLRSVVQDSWRSKLKEDRQMIGVMDEHAMNMQRLLGNVDYEMFCIQNLIANTKSMTKAELRGYIRILEGLAYFYNNKLGTELTSALLAGVTLKAKNLDSLSRYYKLMVGELDNKIKRSEERYKRTNRRLEMLSLDLKYNEASLITRIFQKGKISSIKSRIMVRKARLGRIDSRLNSHKRVLDTVNRVIKGNASL